MKKKPWTLGIVVRLEREHRVDAPARLPEDRLCRALCEAAPAYGMRAIVLSPQNSGPRSPRMQGYTLEAGAWQFGPVVRPDVVYDRYFARSGSELLALSRLLGGAAERQGIPVLGSRLPGKLEVYRTLRRWPAGDPLLPPTVPYRGSDQLVQLLGRSRAIVLKPNGGMQGRGVLRVRLERDRGRWELWGRNSANAPLRLRFEQFEALTAELERIMGRRRYLVQRYLELSDARGRPFDVRALVQKDGRGQWRLTGQVVRLGQPGSLTANLHGGGSAEPALDALPRLLGARAASNACARIEELSLAIARRLEQAYGRSCEFGLDYGLEPEGRLWLLEANSKPGHQAFSAGAESDFEASAMLQPLAYAHYLCSRQPALSFIETRFQAENVQEVHS
ncbi:YheC/YheD family protein [Paenibacillus sp. IB182496]|uniref:YheC/YheD family protein n=1 Tax=Paenibacillus sabuli TaxID=2772509 RepID=A0A927BWQ9_9BACL|nr:YheC/YheD family protein [Paenibacillus sabuli]MBD2848262.1 YheC/YheD family protein [Paenibacillus sabuli]